MLSQNMQDALNGQINEELFSAYLYASMASHFEHTSLPGFAQWMRVQSEEELVHARKLVTYVNNRNGQVIYKAIAAPQTDWASPLAALQDAYKHECHISECINKLQSLSLKLNDHATHAFLEWFVTEQVEEEANVDKTVQALKMVADAPSGLFLLDREMAQRSAAPPAPATD
ncbi:MAG: ferritin [Candidatus Hydrogenedentes bacterium]|nr:ferritin [Candidatus Hydrogenedentota bacterium]